MQETKITTVDEDDLNLIDKMNGEGKVASKGPVYNDEGDTLKGALTKYAGYLSYMDEQRFLRAQRQKLFRYQVERFNYLNLPDTLNKYRIEAKIIEHGSVAIVKIGDVYSAVNYTIKDFNIYNEPTVIQVMEPKSKILNGRVFTIGEDVSIIRNNHGSFPLWQEAYRYINNMEKILFQLEKNVTASAPKMILNLKNGEFEAPGEQGNKKSLEHVVNGQDTVYVYKPKSIQEQQAGGENDDPIYIPIELTDRSESLVKQYQFFKEQVKEIVGAAVLSMSPKKERLTTAESDNDQSISNAMRQHAFNIRKVDIETTNKVFGTSIAIEIQVDTSPEELDEDEDIEEE